MSDATRRAIRTALQLIVSSSLTAVVNALVGGLSPQNVVYVLAIWQIVVTLAHNWLEDNTAFPALLKAQPSPGLNPVIEGPAIPNADPPTYPPTP